MAKPVSLPVKVNLVHQSIRCNFVVAGAGNFCLSQACISHLEVWIWHAVRETSHTDSDAFQDTITGKLVHNQWGLNITGLLVVVWYKATDKVRLTTVKCGHELSK